MNRERIRWLRTKLGRLFRRRRQEAALDAEMNFHFDQLVAEFRAAGLSADDARSAARREFGATDVYREEVRDAWRPPALADGWRTLRFAVRALVRSPGFTLTAVVTLALGIGANTAMFSTLNTVLLEALPYRDSDQLDRIYRTTAQEAQGGVAPADYLDLLDVAAGYGEICAYAPGSMSLSEPGRPAEYSPAARVSENFFSTLGVKPQLGRDFGGGEATRGNHRVLVISHRCWQNRFGGARDVVGRVVRVDGVPHEIVGVLPATFNDWRHLGWVDLFRPLGLIEAEATDRHHRFLQLVGRRSSARPRAETDGFIAAFGQRLAGDFPEANAESTWRTVPLDDTVLGDTGKVMLAMMLGLSGFILLIACSNIANLLLARTMARAREFALRAALGASRSQVLRPLMAEALLLAGAGGLGAIVVAHGAARWISHATMGDNGNSVVLALDWPVFGWALGAALVTAVAFGLAPALFALRLDVNCNLKSGARGTTSGRGHRRFRHLLIIGQFALAMVLLTGAALFIRGLRDLQDRRQGWTSDRLVIATILLPAADYPGRDDIHAFQRLALERLAVVPGVASASVSQALPFFGLSEVRKYVVQGHDRPEPGHEPAALVNAVSPDYFATVGTGLLAGRAFTDHDSATAPPVWVINEAMAAGLFGSDNPLGRRLAPASDDPLAWGEIVGVVRDVKSIFPDADPVAFQLYRPMAQEPRHHMEVAVLAAGGDPVGLVDSIQAAITALAPDLPVRELQPADVGIARARQALNVLRDLLAGFALLGLGLASLGIYGVIARTMAQRTGEFGIRFALGARAPDITRIVLASGVKLALAGSGLGLLGAFGISRLLAAAYPEMEFENVRVAVGVTTLLIAVALLACYLPARTAARISPMEALRAE